MKRLFLVPFLVALMGSDDCAPADKRTAAASSLGAGALCTWKDGSTSNLEIICISVGRRYSCLVGSDERVACAVISGAPLLEAK
jgi:hypothetical protein